MQQKLYLSILNNFEILYNSKKNYDVIIQTSEENKVIYAHSLVLCCQSSYFDTAFSDNWAEKENGKFIFKKPNVSYRILKIIIRYLYCGQIDLTIRSGLDILKLLAAADEFGINTLSEYIKEFLIKNLKDFLQNDSLKFLEFVFQHETFAVLNDYCLKTICQEPMILFGTDKILALPEHILETLLRRDDLALDAIEVWNNLIKWVHAQQPTVNKDPSKWTKDELTLMERTILKFISLVKFYDIPSEEYYEEVMPYEDLLPKKLRNEILKSYLAPGKQMKSPSRSSVLVNDEHLAQFASWIYKKDEILQKIPYKFNVIFRASIDGNTAADFHAKCNDKGATIVVAKIKGSNKVVGGYNPLDWNGNGDKSTPDSFLFIFENYNNICTGRIGRVIRESHAVRCLTDYGPLFGSYNRGSNDIMVTRDGKWSSVTNSYPNINIPRNFEIDDYEVFQVVKK
ncbi:BTB/POZ domain-containing protein [Rhizophagus irregularis DAOM 181602=DAOM 197198]|nr:BTB/POZ domain-containing protein [Rhizophagus irregularis DAOM 181602=DAOM 197198]